MSQYAITAYAKRYRLIDACVVEIAEQAGQVIDNRTFQVGLFEDDYYDIRYWTIDGQPQPCLLYTSRCV